jgi:hypothetical protein
MALTVPLTMPSNHFLSMRMTLSVRAFWHEILTLPSR